MEPRDEGSAPTAGPGVPHLAHWGTYAAQAEGGEVVAVHPHPEDRDPSPLLGNIPGSIRHRSRVTGPAVRRGWLESGPGPTDRRGVDDYVQVSWEEATSLLAGELRRVIDRHGNSAIYGGSYGWGSAGRFHHAQSQVHRFLNALGGYTRSVNSYSTGAAEVIYPHVIAPEDDLGSRSTTWEVLAEETELFVAFGGVPLKNRGTNHGGSSVHPARDALARMRSRGCRFVSVSPLRDDLIDPREESSRGFGPSGGPEPHDDSSVRWIAPRPGTDVAIMLGLAHVLATEGLHDTAFLARYCVGYERFEGYLLGRSDGIPKDPRWAAELSGVAAEVIVDLAREMASRRTFLSVNWSLQRVQHGEQAPWMGVTLAAMLGQIGLPGGGFGHGYGSMNKPGLGRLPFSLPRLPQGVNPIDSFVPVAAVNDMLLQPGEPFDYDGRRLTYPDIRLVYWAGGNPFHHAQDLGRLRRALGRVDTVVVHDPYWTPMARHADLVMPSTTSLERSDLSGSNNSPYLTAMHPAVERYAESRDDYDTFAAVAELLGAGKEFTQGRTSQEWLEYLYGEWRERVVASHGLDLPTFEAFWELGHLRLPVEDRRNLLQEFRADPEGHPLSTPSGRIEIWSDTIESFGYDDCPGHPAWLEPVEWLGSARAQQFPLHLIANQPRTRLHSQLDHGATSQGSKVQGREPIRLHPEDAAARSIADGDVVRVWNDHGSCLAGAVLDDGLRRQVVQLSTGAWYDPLDPADPSSMCVHGNPNVLTSDRRTSKLAQGSTGQHALVQVERYDGPLPPVRAFTPPVARDRRKGVAEPASNLTTTADERGTAAGAEDGPLRRDAEDDPS